MVSGISVSTAAFPRAVSRSSPAAAEQRLRVDYFATNRTGDRAITRQILLAMRRSKPTIG